MLRSSASPERGMATSSPWVAGLILLLVWTMGIAVMDRSNATALGFALFLATWPALDLAIGAWRGTMPREEIERMCLQLPGPWIALFMALGLLLVR